MSTTKAHLIFVFTLLIGAAIMDQKQYDDFYDQIGGENSKSALAFPEIFQTKNEEETNKQEQDDE